MFLGIIFLIFLLGMMISSLCDEHETRCESIEERVHFRRVKFDGHLYITAATGVHGFGLTHDPDCTCIKGE